MTSHNFGHFNPFFTLLGTMAYISQKEREWEREKGREGERERGREGERERERRGNAISKTTIPCLEKKYCVSQYFHCMIAINFLWIKSQSFTKPKIQTTENEFVIFFLNWYSLPRFSHKKMLFNLLRENFISLLKSKLK